MTAEINNSTLKMLIRIKVINFGQTQYDTLHLHITLSLLY